MVTAIELKEWSDGIWRILVDINIALTNIRIIRVERENEMHSIKQGFFPMFEMQQRFIIVVQLAKVFSDKKGQRLNVIKICNKLECGPFDEEIKAMLDENKAKLTDVFRSHEDVIVAVKGFRVNIESKKEILDKVLDMRDKVYAHSDKDGKFQAIDILELDKLNILAQEMYNTLYGKIFDRYFFFRSEDWDLRWVIAQLKKMEEFRRQITSSSTDLQGSA